MRDYGLDNWDNLQDAVDGLFAYDQGCTSSGINDPLLREAVKNYFKRLELSEQSLVASKLASVYLSESGIKQGYRIEDVILFADWLKEKMEVFC